MGLFSWKFADEANQKRLIVGKECWLLQPNGEHIYEGHYDGYGHFHGHDIYELVVDWNREALTEDMLIKPDRNNYKSDQEYWSSYSGLKNFLKRKLVLKKCKKLSDEEMLSFCQKLGLADPKEWKRELGIDISCYDFQNESLPYPIKICRKPVAYESVPASLEDTMQGCY